MRYVDLLGKSHWYIGVWLIR